MSLMREMLAWLCVGQLIMTMAINNSWYSKILKCIYSESPREQKVADVIKMEEGFPWHCSTCSPYTSHSNPISVQCTQSHQDVGALLVHMFWDSQKADQWYPVLGFVFVRQDHFGRNLWWGHCWDFWEPAIPETWMESISIPSRNSLKGSDITQINSILN